MRETNRSEKPSFDRCQRLRAPFAAEHAGSVGPHEEGPARQRHEGIHHEVLARGQPPGRGAVVRDPEAFGGARVERVRRLAVLGERAGAPAARGDARHLGPARGPVRGAIDPAARGRVHGLTASARSRVKVITSESSIMPVWICFQERPPSVVFHGRCQVPA